MYTLEFVADEKYVNVGPFQKECPCLYVTGKRLLDGRCSNCHLRSSVIILPFPICIDLTRLVRRRPLYRHRIEGMHGIGSVSRLLFFQIVLTSSPDKKNHLDGDDRKDFRGSL